MADCGEFSDMAKASRLLCSATLSRSRVNELAVSALDPKFALLTMHANIAL
jgi:hypothetical protein